MNQASERASPGGSTALSCHWISRWVLVKLPSFSATLAAGSTNTSVPIWSGRTAPSRTSGASRQKVALSVRKRSRTTSHLSRPSARRWNFALGPPTAGFCPIRNSPSIRPPSMSTNSGMWE